MSRQIVNDKSYECKIQRDALSLAVYYKRYIVKKIRESFIQALIELPCCATRGASAS